MTWKWYQKQVAKFFHRVPSARVAEDVKVDGRSGVKRQLDVQILLPMKIKLSEEITVTVDIHIIVDAKNRKRPVEIGLVGQIDDLRDDVGAHLAIIVSPLGFTKGAHRRASKVNVALIVVTSDLLAMLNEVEIPWLHRCQSYLCEEGRGYVDWTPRSDKDQAVLGSCQYCHVLHVLRSDCGSVFAVHEFDEGKSLKCPGCYRIYCTGRDEIHEPRVEVRDELDVMLMTAAYANQSKRISKGNAETIIGRTKWQHAAEPTRNVTASRLMEWTCDGEFLCLTEDGQEDYETFIQSAEDASQ